MSLRGVETAITRSITFSGYRSSHLSPIKGCIGSEIIDEVGYLPITREFRPGYRPIPNAMLSSNILRGRSSGAPDPDLDPRS